MKENKYDDGIFFGQYSQMSRSVNGLKGAGEWHILRRMMPDFEGKRVLDLGCGFGWHCEYAIGQGATSVVGIDLSEKMLDEARKRNTSPQIEYQCMAERTQMPQQRRYLHVFGRTSGLHSLW